MGLGPTLSRRLFREKENRVEQPQEEEEEDAVRSRAVAVCCLLTLLPL
jgi:hypothetical protein